MNSNKTGTVDFHLHSRASNVTDYYAANAFAIPESYSDPLKLHPLLKSRGMKLVTLTDHNSIDGVLAMLHAGLPDVFISAEMTATFPEDGCNVHVTIANVTEKQFAEANRLRENIYDMIAYVDAEIADEAGETAKRGAGRDNVIAYFMTHPLMSTQNRPYGREGSLTVEHIEKMLLLCNCLEVQNGSRTRALNDLTLHLLESLDPAMIERLANKHRIEPKGATPWQKAIVGGSDDHAGINPGRTWTEFPFAGDRPSPNDVIRAIRTRQTRPAGIHGGPVTLAHSLLKLLYDGSNLAKARDAKAVQIGGPLQALLRMVFDSGPQHRLEMLRFRLGTGLRRVLANRFDRGRTHSFEEILEAEVCALLSDPTFRDELEARPQADDRIFWVVGTLVNRIFARYVNNLRVAGTVDLLRAIKELVGLVSSNLFVSLPYLVSFLQQSSDCLIARDARSRFGLAETQKLALVTDTFFDVNGVAATIRRALREAMRRNIDFTVITCLAPNETAAHTEDPEIRRFISEGRLKILPAISNLDFPEYEGLQIRFPPFLDLLKFMQEQGFTKVQVSTPGTVGLAGLLAAKTLQLETAATYHTCIPEYVENYTRDVSLEALAWKYMILFYHSVDEVIVPSKFIARLLHKRGLRNRKLLILDRWVDVDRFHPRNRDVSYWTKYGLENAESLVKFVYVGRIGVEKNLKLVAEAYKALRETREDCHLIVIGDGPYRRELERLLSGVPTTFTGFLGGEELATAIASADAKLFPSTTDTWGNAPLEAQSSGIPVVVSTVGGPAELMRDGETGIKVSGRDVGELRAAMVTLMDRETREWMGRRARAFSEAHRVPEPFTAILDADGYRQRLRAKEARSSSEEASPVEEEISLTNVLDGELERLASGA